MERDLNHYLNEGYSRGEVLAAVLHSVRENYLNKVAVESAIGETIVFQGATAKNRALVAAFEQQLGKPILVSRYCHLTGALGVALTLRDEEVRTSTFRGLGLHRQSIPIRPEICDLCSNHCKLSIAEVGGETVAFGFLCGRDYGMRKRVANNTSGFDLFRERAKALAAAGPRRPRTGLTIGIPAGPPSLRGSPVLEGVLPSARDQDGHQRAVPGRGERRAPPRRRRALRAHDRAPRPRRPTSATDATPCSSPSISR